MPSQHSLVLGTHKLPTGAFTTQFTCVCVCIVQCREYVTWLAKKAHVVKFNYCITHTMNKEITGSTKTIRPSHFFSLLRRKAQRSLHQLKPAQPLSSSDSDSSESEYHSDSTPKDTFTLRVSHRAEIYRFSVRWVGMCLYIVLLSNNAGGKSAFPTWENWQEMR